MIVPIVITLIVVFNQIENYQIEQVAGSELNELKKTEIFAKTNSDIASTVIQTLKANTQIIDLVSRVVSAEELVRFNSQTTPYIENIVITNPYIRSIRIYCDSNHMPERWPVFISNERVAGQAWYAAVRSEQIMTRLGYSEQLSQYSSRLSGNNILSFSSSMNEAQGSSKAVIEVSFYMDDFFSENTEERFCFLVRDGQIFTDTESQKNEKRLALARLASEKLLSSGKLQSFERLGGTSYLLTIQPGSVLGGSFVMVSDLTGIVGKISQSRMFLMALIFTFIIALTLIYEGITSVLLKRIYSTINAMRSLEEGNTNVKIEKPSDDEIGQLQLYFNKMVEKIDDLVEQNTKRSLLEKDAEIKALQNQINSHFLYNVLNNIEMMAVIDENYLIADTVTALGRLLRYSMNWKSQTVSLTGEVDYVKDYLQLFNIRFDNKIQLICDISKEAVNAIIPKMSMQPIVENAIVHGIENMARDAVIKIKVLKLDGDLMIEITDSGCGIDEATLKAINETIKNGKNNTGLTGIGLKNVQERIELSFGGDYGISIKSKLNEYTKVIMKMPFRSE